MFASASARGEGKEWHRIWFCKGLPRGATALLQLCILGRGCDCRVVVFGLTRGKPSQHSLGE
eukprot:4722310-Heterocapsa_arctica.AAC.1